MKRAIGACVLVCLAMITAAPVAAITVGSECEKQCCRRGNKAHGRDGDAHACCKRGKVAATPAFAAGEARCQAGNANVGLARFQVAAVAVPVTGERVMMADAGAMSRTTNVRGEAILGSHALFQRPPPAL